jgi:hypothetical protein
MSKYFYDCTPLKLDGELHHHGQPVLVNLNVGFVVLELHVFFFFFLQMEACMQGELCFRSIFYATIFT